MGIFHGPGDLLAALWWLAAQLPPPQPVSVDRLAVVASEWSNPAVITAIGGVLVVVIGALGGVAVKIIRALSALNRKADAAVATGVAAEKKLDEVHAATNEALTNTAVAVTQTNGNLSKLREELTAQQRHNSALQETIVALTAILSAQRTGGAPPSTVLGTRTTDAPIKVHVVNVDEAKKDGDK